MSSDNHANYAKIGLAAVLGVSLAAGALIYLGGTRGAKDRFEAETFFSYPVSGLEVGSAVNFRGVRIGTVKRISFIGAEYDVKNASDAQKIYVLLSLDRRLLRLSRNGLDAEERLSQMVRHGLHATVAASGVTGLSKIELNIPSGDFTDEEPSWKPRNICIPPAPSLFQSAADSVTKILDQLNHINLLDAWTNLTVTLSDTHTFMGGVNSLIETERAKISDILSNARDASVLLRDFTEEIRQSPALLLRSANPDPLPETR